MFIYYSIACITAPTTGVIVGGIVIQGFGGYGSPKAIHISFLMAMCATLSALPIPFIDSFYIVLALMWSLLFCGGFILPILTGILLNSVGLYERTVANSLANLSYNLLGYLPAPSVYGLICSLTGGEKSRWGLTVLMYWTIFSSGCLFITLMIKLTQAKNNQAKINNSKNSSSKLEEFGEPMIGGGGDNNELRHSMGKPLYADGGSDNLMLLKFNSEDSLHDEFERELHNALTPFEN